MSDKRTETIEVHDLAQLKGKLKPIGGSMSDDWNNIIANQTIQTQWAAAGGTEGK